MKVALALLLVLVSFPIKAFAWGTKGHEVVAYIAYENLDDPTRKQVDYLITLNPCYQHVWLPMVASVPAANQSVALFMLAATWPDQIKQPTYNCDNKPDFILDGARGTNGRIDEDVPPPGPEASQNLVYTDDRRHKYWHFVNTPFSPDNTPTDPGATPSALTEVLLLTEALQSKEDNDLKSYDLVWVEHLVGDLHQPLHDATRFTSSNLHGDAGGNDVSITGSDQDLHAYWDHLPGTDGGLAAAIKMGQLLNKQPASTAAVLALDDPASWANDSFLLAQKYAYASPVTTGSAPVTLNAAYQANATKVMNQQIFLAGQRLAALLNEDLA